MNMSWKKATAPLLISSVLLMLNNFSFANQALNDARDKIDANASDSVKSQQQVDVLDDDYQGLLQDFRATNGETDQLKLYNKQMMAIVNNQQAEIKKIDQQIRDIEFTEQGILTKSGELLEADIIVTATGFNMSITGDIAIDVDGSPVDLGETFTYRGLMFSGVPNMSFMFGYLRTPWTMRVDLVSEFVCRLLNHMDSNASSVCTPTLRGQDRDMDVRPFIDFEDISSGWLQRHIHLMPKQGGNVPWGFSGDYFLEKDELPAVSLDENSLVYEFRSAQKMA